MGAATRVIIQIPFFQDGGYKNRIIIKYFSKEMKK